SPFWFSFSSSGPCEHSIHETCGRVKSGKIYKFSEAENFEISLFFYSEKFECTILVALPKQAWYTERDRAARFVEKS
ncbi:MAG: hypothetical protein IJX59_08025, partial [Clostridia bacterium]|nr:hypothetical protein [Clostridia bacterium]